MNKIQDAFSQIRAEDALKQKTLAALQRKHPARSAPLRLAVAACILMLLLLAGGGTAWLMPVSTISIDINPSVQLSLNRFNRVVSAQAGNQDGARVLEEVALQFKPYEQAVEALLSCDSLARFQKTNELLEVTVVSGQAEKLTAGIEQCPSYGLYQGSCQTADSDTLKAAGEAGLSVGRYLAWLELAELDPSVTPEDCQEMTMREIRERIAEAGGTTEWPGGQGTGNQYGQEPNNQNGQGAGNQYGQGTNSQNGQGNGHQYGKMAP